MRILFAAPHRLAFLVGFVNLAILAAWWLWQVAALHAGALALPQSDLPPVLLHGHAMLFLIFPPFVFGFLLTVFPRWMSYPDLGQNQFGPVAVLLALGGVVAHAGLWSGNDGMLLAGFAVEAAAWAVAVMVLLRVVIVNRRDRKPACWHALSALGALVFGLAGLSLAIAFLATGQPNFWRLGNLVGIYGFLVPLFLTVAHRMVPFFAGNVVKHYQRWRPDWLLAAIWLQLGGLLAGEVAELSGLVLASATGMALTSGFMAWKWWPRSPAPGLMKVLIWGFAWAPLAFALLALTRIGVPLGRAPVHALTIGFASSLMVGMVTRVTQGHSGRPLEMPGLAWIAYAGIQIAAIGRVIAAIRAENGVLVIAVAAVFLLALLPWALRNSAIYCAARIDGRPG